MDRNENEEELFLLRQRVRELELSEARYRGAFESSPVSLWEQDWTGVKVRLDGLLASGVTDLDAYLLSHPEEVLACVGAVRVVDVNRATLDLCRAASKDHLRARLSVVFNESTMETFRRELVAMGSGAMSYEEETILCTADGELRIVMFRIVVSADCEQTWERCFVSLVDITDRKRAEEDLSHSREETIRAQKDMLARLSTPVIPISDEVIVMPLIGALDRARMQEALSALLDELQKRQASVAILDITGVPEMDEEATYGIAQVAQGVRLLGAQVVLTGIRPEVARRLIELGSNLEDIVTRGTLQAGIAYAIQARRSRR